MDWGYIALIALVFGALLIIAQRVVPRHRRMTRGFIVTMAIMLMCRYDPSLQVANLIGYALALFISFLFWLLIGRYNPVKAEADIKVYGLND